MDFIARTPDGATGGHHFDRMRTHHPIDDVDVVQVLFDDLIA